MRALDRTPAAKLSAILACACLVIQAGLRSWLGAGGLPAELVAVIADPLPLLPSKDAPLTVAVTAVAIRLAAYAPRPDPLCPQPPLRVGSNGEPQTPPAAASQLASSCRIQNDCPANTFCLLPALSRLPGACAGCWQCCLFPNVYGATACSRCRCGLLGACYSGSECGAAEYCAAASAVAPAAACRSCALCRNGTQPWRGSCYASCASGAIDANGVPDDLARHYLYAAFALAEADAGVGGGGSVGMGVGPGGVVSVTQLEGLSWRLPGADKDVLSGITGEQLGGKRGRASSCFRSGQLSAILGPSGCGKTSLLALLAGRATPSEGRLLVDGRQVDDPRVLRRIAGFVPQDDVMCPDLTVRENLEFSAALRLCRHAPAGADRPPGRALLRKWLSKGTVSGSGGGVGHDSSDGSSGEDGLVQGRSGRGGGGAGGGGGGGGGASGDPSAHGSKGPGAGSEVSSKEERRGVVDTVLDMLALKDASCCTDTLRALSDVAETGVNVVAVLHQPRYGIFVTFHEVVIRMNHNPVAADTNGMNHNRVVA
ncbi:putative white-brown complex 30 [Tetrabaena socialis]|uniref:Putative white-brown complex 30 n=1 Tax=Tetrabaena socialis TaxID=47790 RepID=A0A2J8ACC0_9CHLO|nr:putative white-brown complex 30 [Tetrabaena socialis]|eukprot:PNH10143.1 putative white-brown complex 30 [Tetrabaena socialis]